MGHSKVIELICLNILSIPYYEKRLRAYNMDSVIKSLCSEHIWNEIITHFEEYCLRVYNSFIFVSEKSESTQDAFLWKTIPSSLTMTSLMSNPIKNKKTTEEM